MCVLLSVSDLDFTDCFVPYRDRRSRYNVVNREFPLTFCLQRTVHFGTIRRNDGEWGVRCKLAYLSPY